MSPEGQHVDGTTNSKNCRTLGAGYPNLWSYILGLRIEKDTGGDIVCKLTHSNCASFQLCTFQTNHRQSKHTHNCMPFILNSAHFELFGRCIDLRQAIAAPALQTPCCRRPCIVLAYLRQMASSRTIRNQHS